MALKCFQALNVSRLLLLLEQKTWFMQEYLQHWKNRTTKPIYPRHLVLCKCQFRGFVTMILAVQPNAFYLLGATYQLVTGGPNWEILLLVFIDFSMKENCSCGLYVSLDCHHTCSLNSCMWQYVQNRVWSTYRGRPQISDLKVLKDSLRRWVLWRPSSGTLIYFHVEEKQN